MRAFEPLPAGPPALRSAGFNPVREGRPAHTTEMFALLALVGQLQNQIQDLQKQRRVLASENAHLEEQVRMASQVQRELMPSSVDFPGVEVSTLYRPVDCISGDMYDIARLDEAHLAISLADATGHGMSAALLSMMLKRSFRGKVILGDSYHILDAADVLRKVNRELLETEFRQCQFVTGLHAVYHGPTRTLSLARGGQSYPILLRRNCRPVQLVSQGPIVGAFEEAEFETLQVQLEPGDRVLFYTDGLDALLLERAGHPHADSVIDTPWFAGLADLEPDAILRDLADRLGEVSPQDWPADDLTMIALAVRD